MMKRFVVCTRELVETTYEVEAFSEEDARDLVRESADSLEVLDQDFYDPQILWVE